MISTDRVPARLFPSAPGTGDTFSPSRHFLCKRGFTQRVPVSRFRSRVLGLPSGRAVCILQNRKRAQGVLITWSEEGIHMFTPTEGFCGLLVCRFACNNVLPPAVLDSTASAFSKFKPLFTLRHRIVSVRNVQTCRTF